MKALFLLTTLILMVTSAFCQETFPKKVLIKGKELVLITPEQVKEVNKAYLTMRYYRDVKDSLELKITMLELSNINLGTAFDEQKGISDNYMQLYENEKLVSERLTDDLEATDVELKKVTFINKIGKPVLAVSLVANVVMGIIIFGN